MTDKEFESEFGRLAAFYDWTPNEPQVEIWWEVFETETGARFRAGVDALCSRWRPSFNQRYPLPEDMRESMPPFVPDRPPERLRSPEEKARGLRLLRVILDRFEGKIDETEMKRRMAEDGVEVTRG